MQIFYCFRFKIHYKKLYMHLAASKHYALHFLLEIRFHFACKIGQKIEITDIKMDFQNNLPWWSSYKVVQNQTSLPRDQDSTALKQYVLLCLPPNLISRWVRPIKELSANVQSSLTSFKQLQSPSCPKANFCQRKKKKKNHQMHESRCCLSLDLVCSFQYYWP